jgi:S1-C subfamily serine protease
MSNVHRLLTAALLATCLTAGFEAHAQIPMSIGENHEMPSLAPLLRRVTPSVVSVAVRRRMTEEELAMLNDPAFQHPLGPSVPAEAGNIYAAGSGVIIDAERGFIVTGHHVVDGADEIVVILADGRRLIATPVGSDAETDVAVVRVRAKNLIGIRMGDSDRLEVGDFVLSIGNPYSIGQTITSGIVSAIRRRSWEEQGYEDLIQTDAAINLGSSGGALINLRGELVGMNSAILDTGDPNGGNIGIGFATSGNTVRATANQLVKYGSASHGQLGVAVSPMKPDGGAASGVVITRVAAGSPAALADLRTGDVISALNALPIRDEADLHIKSAMFRVGEVVELNIVRDGRAFSLRATLVGRSEDNTLDGKSLGALIRGGTTSDR